MPKTTTTEEKQTLEIQEINTGEITAHLVGTSPLIMHRFVQKAWQELLLPSRRQNRASLEQKLKHNPVEEFRQAVYLNRDQNEPTAIHLPNPVVHGTLAAAALDIPGVKKAVIERLTQVVDVNINLYGLPRLFMAMVRNSDQNRTPDVRTRPIFPQWACTVTIQYMMPVLSQRTIANLLGAAGQIVGFGDWRRQKGGPYGAFRLASEDDAELRAIMRESRAAPRSWKLWLTRSATIWTVRNC